MSVKEGELKRRIHENFDVIPKPVMIFLEDILDEVNGDYPEWRKPAHATGQNPNSAELTQALIIHSLKVEAWKKRWFGEDEK